MTETTHLTPLVSFALIAAGVALAVSAILRLRRQHLTTVQEGQRGVIYKDGVFEREVGPGAYSTWGGRSLTAVPVNLQTLVVQGQEMLTQDRLPVRLSALATLRVINARKALETTEGGFGSALYQDIQLALRNLAASMPLDALVDQRTTLDERLQALCADAFNAQGCELVRIALRDVILPAEVRRLASDVVRAKMETASALERARGEQATLRSLANAARVLKGNPELMNLRVLHALQTAPGKTPPTLILSGGASIVPVSKAETEPVVEVPDSDV